MARRRSAFLVVVAASLGAAAVRGEDPPPVEQSLALKIREATLKAAKAMAARPPKAASMKDERTLVALALLRGGGRAERKVARELLDGWWDDANKETWIVPSANYELSLYIQALEGLSLVRIDEPSPTQEKPRFRVRQPSAEDKARLEKATRVLIASGVKTFEEKGLAWGYGIASLLEGTTSRGITFTNGREKDYWDNSNAQFSVLALHEAARAGVAIPKDVAEKVGRHFLLSALEVKARGKPGGTATGGEALDPLRWGYKKDDRTARESMLFAGLSSLAIARELGFKDPEVDTAIKRALVGIEPHVRRGGKAVNGEPGWGDPYQLYSIEKALDLLEIATVDGKEWFPPLAKQVLAEQAADGLWNGNFIDTSFYVIFLTRGTLSGERLVTSGLSGQPGDVVLPKSKKVVNAVQLLRAFGKAEGKEAAKAKAEADEAVSLLAAEGHGQDACLLRPLAELAAEKGPRADAALRWAKDLAGETVTKAQLDTAVGSYEGLRDTCDIAALRGALGKGSLIPIRAFAAAELVALRDRLGALVLCDACETLADQGPLLATAAGGRCARSFTDALTSLLVAALPELPAKGSPSGAQLKAVAKAAREKAAAK